MSGAVPRPRRILVIQLRRLGDVVLTTALLDDLRRAHQEARLDFLVGEAAAPLLEGHPLIDERIVYDRARSVGMWRDVRARRYDWIIDVQSSPRTAPLTLLSGAPVRVGWNLTGWGWVYTHRLSRSGRPPEYVVRERQRLLELIGIPVGHARPRLHLSARERARGEADAIGFGAAAGSPRVGMLLSAGEQSKAWRVEGFADVARGLAASGVATLIFQGPGDAPLVARLAQLAPEAVIVPPLDVRRFLGVLAACRVFVSGDTGPVHMATALDVPTVTVFGPTAPGLWSPALPITAVVRDERVPCLACQHDVCPIGHDCMVGVSGAMVLTRVRHFLGMPELVGLTRG